jgi:pantothenate kinase
MTKKMSVPKLPSVEELRKEQELRLYVSLENVEPGSDQYTKILAQIASLDAHSRTLELKQTEYAQEDVKHEHTVIVEDLKQMAAIRIEQRKIDAAQRQKNVDIAAKLLTVGIILVFEHSGNAIISKAFGLIRD